ncbi:DNA-directed RNA polymerase subunit alpha C-terminal domain-containing protein [Bacillus infantis]|uniref:DNA-directed RNA polymerase subunit alpha C-terminal domain-containing protein n=1 Tax=Bacillus infantis TaxID=324767 RepID=UPI003CF4C4A4
MLICQIETLIRKSGLRKDFIADKLGITTRQLRNYELQKSYIPMDKAYILAEILKCSLDDLYKESGPKPKFFLSDPIEILNLSQRTYHALKRSGIHTLQELLEKEDVIQLRGVGAVSIQEISTKISEVRRELSDGDSN